MAFFTQAAFSSLYLGPKAQGDVGYVAFIPGRRAATPAAASIALETALSDEALGGSFVFSPQPLDFSGDAAGQQAFVTKLWEFLNANNPRGIVWVARPQDVLAAKRSLFLPILGLSSSGNQVVRALNAAIVSPSLSLTVDSGMRVKLSGESLSLNGAELQTGISFNGAAKPTANTVLTGTLPFSGPERGAIRFTPFIQRRSLLQQWNMGFQFTFPHDGSSKDKLSECLLLAKGKDGAAADDRIGFSAVIDPADPLGTANPLKSILYFTGANQDQKITALASCYRTVNGDTVTLWPLGKGNSAEGAQTAALVFTLGQEVVADTPRFLASPLGDFVMDAPTGPDGVTSALLAGLSGAEFLSFVPGKTAANGTRLRFSSGQPAYAPQFPPPASSPVAKPSDPNAPLLTDWIKTSWATLLPPAAGNAAIAYVAQPNGSSLFGQDGIISARYQSLFGSMDPGLVLPDAGTAPFPLAPYAGATPGNGVTSFSADQIERFETLVIGPTRRAIIGAAKSSGVHSARSAARGLKSSAQSSFNATTPSGVIATIACEDGDCRWSKILLGQTVTPSHSEMAFNKPSPELQQAFQTNQLFMVAANNLSLVDPAKGSFSNILNVENWVLQADVGTSPGYDDYANVMIVKGVKGVLYDSQGNPDDNLVANPSKWTQRDAFATPSTSSDAPDPDQLPILSKWLQDYFAAAASQKDNAYFRRFNAIAKDPHWTGVLILRAHIAEVPSDLAGVMAGISDPTRFYAHHFAIEISQVKNDAAQSNGQGIGIDRQSSVFGLIYYVDPAYNEAKPTQPVAPTAGQNYDYRVLTLKVLFENTAVTNFSSYAQLTLNKLFASPVDHMGAGGNGYNSIVLSGAYQNNQGRPVYSMSASKDWAFYFDNPILNKVEITGAQMTTLDPGSDKSDAVIWFALTGFMDFSELYKPADDGNGTPFDLFSFGNSRGQDALRQGLSFCNLGLRMSYPTAAPADRSIVFDAAQIRFDMQTSTPRRHSLYTMFSLTFEGLVCGSGAKKPKELGYLDLITDLRLSGVGDGEWYGLRYRLDMGTPGQLAGDVGLTSTLLTAWGPHGGGDLPASAHLALPGTGGGAKLISLQTVLSLSVGMLRLTYDVAKDGFLLMMTEIALKFLGISKIPPNGATSFYLFGNPNGGGKPSGLGWYAMYKQKQKAAREGDGAGG